MLQNTVTVPNLIVAYLWPLWPFPVADLGEA